MLCPEALETRFAQSLRESIAACAAPTRSEFVGARGREDQGRHGAMLSAAGASPRPRAAFAWTFRLDCGRLDEDPAMRCVLIAAAAIALWLATPAAATDVSVRVRDAQGKPVVDAVVTLDDGGARATAATQV